MTEEEQTNESGKEFLDTFFPVIFIESMKEATSDEEKDDLALKFGRSPVVNFESFKRLLTSIAQIGEEGLSILPYAKKSMNCFLNEQTDKQKNGISIQNVHNGKIITSIGHTLNEGITEWYTIKMRPEMIAKLKKINPKDEINEGEFDGAYLLEVECADKLIKLTNERLVGRAYFGGMEDYYLLMEEFDKIAGAGKFIWLLLTSDQGDWKTIFTFFKKFNL